MMCRAFMLAFALAGASALASCQHNPKPMSEGGILYDNTFGGRSMVTKVTTEMLDDNAVTLDKMAPGTDGNLISYDSNGDPVAVGTGAAAEVLTSNGPGLPPSMQTPAAAQTEVQLFTSSGTWTKPAFGTIAHIQAVGGGGSGGGTTGGGGGGGASISGWLLLSALGATETVTIGDGGIGVSSGVGNPGGNTTFGSFVTAYGGGAGDVAGGGGGGTGGLGADASSTTGGTGGTSFTTGSGAAANANAEFSGAGGGESGNNGGGSIHGGGGGSVGAEVQPGGTSIYGGGGGAGSHVNSTGGVSIFGGDGGLASTIGDQPGGGGGGSTATSGDGADGQVTVTVY